MTAYERQKKRRDRLKLIGVCVQCRSRSAVRGRTCCSVCAERYKILNRARGPRYRPTSRSYTCILCSQRGHNVRTCPGIVVSGRTGGQCLRCRSPREIGSPLCTEHQRLLAELEAEGWAKDLDDEEEEAV